MNLTDLFNQQRKLDEEIERKHSPVEGEDRFSKKKLALLVEIGELANEQRSWKFWSEDQKPRNKKYHFLGSDNIIHQTYEDPENDEEIQQWIGFEKIDEVTNPLLEEYVDVLHFLLSIGNEYAKHKPNFYAEYDLMIEKHSEDVIEQIPGQFNAIFYHASKLGGGWNEEFQASIDLDSYKYTFLLFIGLGEMLGFTQQQIEQAYNDKNKTNWERQANGY